MFIPTTLKESVSAAISTTRLIREARSLSKLTNSPLARRLLSGSANLASLYRYVTILQ